MGGHDPGKLAEWGDLILSRTTLGLSSTTHLSDVWAGGMSEPPLISVYTQPCVRSVVCLVTMVVAVPLWSSPCDLSAFGGRHGFPSKTNTATLTE